MATLFGKQARIYAAARPTYPSALYKLLASLSKGHKRAWDVGATTSPTSTTSSTSSTTSTTPTTSTSPSLTTSSTTSPSTSTTPSSSPSTSTSTTIVTPADGGRPSTIIQTVTTTNAPITTASTASSAATSSTPSATAVGSPGSQTGGGSNNVPANIVAPAVVAPIIGIALAVFLGIFFWRRRKERQRAAEMRQKEMEEYSYNPNSDPTIPVVGAVSSNGDDHSGEGGGYRGWGTTSSAGPRKASTTLGGTSNPGAIGVARSDSGGRGYDDYHALTPEHDSPVMSGAHDGVGALGAGPLASNNKNQGVNRGISNASSAYSGGQRSDGSDNAPGGFAGSPQQYYDELMQPDEGLHEGYGQPVIRDVSARRNTRIENPAIYPQHGNAGIAQNF